MNPGMLAWDLNGKVLIDMLCIASGEKPESAPAAMVFGGLVPNSSNRSAGGCNDSEDFNQYGNGTAESAWPLTPTGRRRVGVII